MVYMISCYLQLVTVYFFLSSWMPYISFSCLIALAWTANTVVNKSGEGEHPCLVPDPRGKAFSFSLLYMMLAVGMLYMAFIMLRYLPSTHLC